VLQQIQVAAHSLTVRLLLLLLLLILLLLLLASAVVSRQLLAPLMH
jgi:hypothetical protein